jgi:hypothetical protein
MPAPFAPVPPAPIPLTAVLPALVPAVAARAPPQAMAPAEVLVTEETVHLPGILVEIVGMQMSCQGRLWEEHEQCGDC